MIKAVPSETEQARLDMLNTELTQMVYIYPELVELIDGDEVDFGNINIQKWNNLANAIMIHPGASNTLKAFLRNKYQSQEIS